MDTLSRRTFLMQSAALAAVAAAPSTRAAANERIGLAVIGCRNRGHQVADKCLESGRYDLVTLCDCDSAMAERGLDNLKGRIAAPPRIERDFRRVLEDPDVDAVVVATPDHWHAAMTLLALDAGKHVFLEKPATYNIEEGVALTEAAANHPGLALLVGTQQRSAPHFAEARDFIREGGLGRIGFCRAWVLQNRGVLKSVPDSDPPATLDYDLWLGPAPLRPYNDSRVHYNWRFIRDYGTGEMGNWGAHWIDTMLWFLDLDFPRAVSGHGGQFVVRDAKEWPDTQTVVYEYPEMTLLWEQRIWTEFAHPAGKVGAELGGEKGSLTITRSGWTFHPRDGEPQTHPARGDMERIHAENFAACIRGEAAPTAPMSEGHKTAALCHMGNIAAALGARLEFDRSTQTFQDDRANAWIGREYRAPWSL